MKIQDIGFIVIFVALLAISKPRLLVVTGLGCLILAMPLFYFQVFFTAERLTWYAGGLFVTYIAILIINELKG